MVNKFFGEKGKDWVEENMSFLRWDNFTMTANSDQVMPLCCTCHMALEVKYDSNPSLEGADNKFYKIHSLFIENWPVIIHLWTG